MRNLHQGSSSPRPGRSAFARRVLTLSAAALAVGAALVPATSSASFPSGNGLIVFVSARDGDNELFSMTPTGGSVTQLTTNTANDRDPAVSPDGTKVAFTSNRDGDEEIFVMNIDGHLRAWGDSDFAHKLVQFANVEVTKQTGGVQAILGQLAKVFGPAPYTYWGAQNPQDYSPDVTGKVTGDQIELSFEVQGNKIAYKGTIAKDSMKGEADYADRMVAFRRTLMSRIQEDQGVAA